jgi:hypothetical protein
MEPNQMLDWIKRPENLTTALILGAALAQPRDPGRNAFQTVLQRGAGALAFRGGMENQIQDQRLKEGAAAEQAYARQETQRSNKQREDLTGQQIGVDKERNVITRENIAATTAEGTANRANALTLKQTPDALTPEQKNMYNQQAGYYSRMPQAPGGGAGGKSSAYDPFVEDDIEMFKKWADAKIAAGQTPDPLEWTKTMAPVLAMRTQMRSMMQQGIMPTINQRADGSYELFVGGVAPPANGATPGAVPDQGPTGLAAIAGNIIASDTERRQQTEEAAKPVRPETIAKYKDSLGAMDSGQLNRLLVAAKSDKNVSLEDLKAIRAAIRARVKLEYDQEFAKTGFSATP